MKEKPLPCSAGFIRKTLTESEHNELDHWIEASDDNMLFF